MLPSATTLRDSCDTTPLLPAFLSFTEAAGALEKSHGPLQKEVEPGHPDADGQGYVSYPPINPVTEREDLMGAVRAYKLNASAVSAVQSMIQQAIDLLH